LNFKIQTKIAEFRHSREVKLACRGNPLIVHHV